ncbi:MAG: PD-(D/E)XK nuclease family protein [Bdellovibrionales bacterium]|nr:PD-(D/E)XK nuclease family protein [Bdellovibrionales bacterium]
MSGGASSPGWTAEELSGLRPRAWLCVGPGYSREDLKAEVLGAGAALTAEAVTSPAALALRILSAAADPSRGRPAPETAGPGLRQEMLRSYLRGPKAAEVFPEIRRLSRQRGFITKLDRALSEGSLLYSHEAEAEAYVGRLEAAYGASPLRTEMFSLRGAFELMLKARGLADEAGLFRMAAESLETRGWPASLNRPDRVILLCARRLESLERHFFERLGAEVPVVESGLLPCLSRGHGGIREAGRGGPPGSVSWQRWHTLDDACDALAAACLRSMSEGGDPAAERVLIPDEPATRRSLMRALTSRGIVPADPRDPTGVRRDENVKRALLPLRVAARGFARADVRAWLRAWRAGDPRRAAWAREIHGRGARRGREAYSGGALAEVVPWLARLDERFGGRLNWRELAERLVGELRQGPVDGRWTRFFEAQLASLGRDLDRIGQGGAKRPALYWLERLQDRLDQSPPPVEGLKPAAGIGVYRLQQAPPARAGDAEGPPRGRLWILGLPPQWCAGEARGDAWWSARDREALSAEFEVRGSRAVRDERIAALRAWMAEAQEVIVLDALHSWDGSERESILADLVELPGFHESSRPEEKGAFVRWLPSLSSLRAAPPQRPRLAADEEWRSRPVEATELDHYSRCAFLGLSDGRWRLQDLDEPDAELLPTARGTLLHRAVELLVGSWGPRGFGLEPRAALDQAWQEHRPRGLMASDRVTSHAKDKLERVLRVFTEKEMDYRERSGAKTLELESKDPMTLELGGDLGSIRGRPDRVDEHPEGLFVIDYKTSSAQPSGKDMLELGYRLQLPFYALAARGRWARPVAGAQFVELTRAGGRTKGVFLKRLNGKDAGKLTNTRARNSLFDETDPDALWSLARTRIEEHVARLREGRFEADPKKPGDCASCRSADLCGRLRLGADAEEQGEPAPEA